jgi:hypothetical protein
VDNADNLVPGQDNFGPLVSDVYGTDPATVNERMFYPGPLVVDIYDNQKVYFLLGGKTNSLYPHGGVWHYDRTGDTFTHLYVESESSTVGAFRGDVVISTAFNPPRVVYGTHCNGIKWFNYPGPGLW